MDTPAILYQPLDMLVLLYRQKALALARHLYVDVVVVTQVALDDDVVATVDRESGPTVVVHYFRPATSNASSSTNRHEAIIDIRTRKTVSLTGLFMRVYRTTMNGQIRVSLLSIRLQNERTR